MATGVNILSSGGRSSLSEIEPVDTWLSTLLSWPYTNLMGSELTPKNAPTRRLRRSNMMAFPRQLRETIPDLHGGRVLELDSINGRSSNTVFFGPLVELKIVVKETGKLSGRFAVRMILQIDAARELAATLNRLADQAEQS